MLLRIVQDMTQRVPAFAAARSHRLPASLPPLFPDECLLLGTSAGHLQLHSAASGALLLRQQLHHTATLAAAVRWGGSGTDPEDLSEDVTVTFADAVVRLPAWEVWAAVRWHAGHAERSSGSHWWSAASAAATAAAGGGAPHHLAFSKFTLPRGTGGCRRGAVCLQGAKWGKASCSVRSLCTAGPLCRFHDLPIEPWRSLLTYCFCHCPAPSLQAPALPLCAWARRRPAFTPL